MNNSNLQAYRGEQSTNFQLVRMIAELLVGGTVVIMVAVAVGGRGSASQGRLIAICVGNSDSVSSVEQGL